MFVVHSPLLPLRRYLDGIMTRCSKLIAMTCDTYRPELHYMRGPGPKWYAKHRAVPTGKTL